VQVEFRHLKLMAVAESYPGCFSTIIAEARLSKNAAVGSPLLAPGSCDGRPQVASLTPSR
jgi:hypothetical protein